MIARLRIVLSCLLVASLVGCSGGSSPGGSGGGGGTGGQLSTTTSAAPGVCVPGASVACVCATGQQGAQTCTAAGTFAACMCSAPTVDAGGLGGSDGAATSQPDTVTIVGGTGDSPGTGGEGGPVADAAADQSADVLPAVSDASVDAAVDAGEGEEASGTTPSILSFTASPTTISAGKSSTLSWTVTGAAMLFVDQGVGSNLVSMLGATSLAVTPTQTTTYTLTLNGSVSAQVTVTVVPLPLVTSFSASSAVVKPGGNSTLTAVFSGGTGTVDQGVGVVTSGVGTSTGPVIAITTYTLTVTNAFGGSTTAQVTVVPGVPPPVDSLGVWVDAKTAGNAGQIALTLRIDNKTSSSVDMTAVTLRYWYQDEGLGTALVFANNYVMIGYSIAGTVTGKAVAAPSPVAGADHYIELAFTGILSAQGDKSSNDQLMVHVTAHTASYAGTVDVTNDYSYDGGAAKVYEDKITLYESGKLIWGVEPGTSLASPGPYE